MSGFEDESLSLESIELLNGGIAKPEGKFIPINLDLVSESLRKGAMVCGREFLIEVGEEKAAVWLHYFPGTSYHHSRPYHERLHIETDLTEIKLNYTQMLPEEGKVTFRGTSHIGFRPAIGRKAMVEVTVDGILRVTEEILSPESQG